MNRDCDLPGSSRNEVVEEWGILAVRAELNRSGFLAMEVPGRFDKGIDLLVSPRDGAHMLPAIAGIQVKTGRSYGRRVPVGRHSRYWRELNLPVFGVVLELEDDDTGATRGGWVDLKAHLGRYPDSVSIPVTHEFPTGFGDALRGATGRTVAEGFLLDVFSEDPWRQATAVVALAPLAEDPRVQCLLATALGDLNAVALHWALRILASIDTTDAAFLSRMSTADVVRAADFLYDIDESNFDAAILATHALLDRMHVDRAELEQMVLQHTGGDNVICRMALALSLAGDDAPTLLDRILTKQPRLSAHPEVQDFVRFVGESGYYSLPDSF